MELADLARDSHEELPRFHDHGSLHSATNPPTLRGHPSCSYFHPKTFPSGVWYCNSDLCIPGFLWTSLIFAMSSSVNFTSYTSHNFSTKCGRIGQNVPRCSPSYAPRLLTLARRGCLAERASLQRSGLHSLCAPPRQIGSLGHRRKSRSLDLKGMGLEDLQRQERLGLTER